MVCSPRLVSTSLGAGLSERLADEILPGALWVGSYRSPAFGFGSALRALLMRNTQTVSALGCLALAEEDLALCTYACPGKFDYGLALRNSLRERERGR